MVGICVCFLNCRRQVVVQLIWVVVGCRGDGRWWLSVLLPQWIFVAGGCAVVVVVVVVVDDDDDGEELIYYLMCSKYYFNV